jgi:large subunit ribosomal protein L17
MRHRKKLNHLSRKAAHRKAMLANMANSLILHKRIKTTTAKAKALRMYVEPLITKSKNDTTHSRRLVFAELQNKDAVSELFREVSPKIVNRPGGYTRILKTGTRLGDNADMCIIELVDYNENLLAAKEEATKKSTTRRSRRGGKKKASAESSQTTQTETKASEEAAEKSQEEAKAEENNEETTSEKKEEGVDNDESAEEKDSSKE